MESDREERQFIRQAALIYLPITLGTAALFFSAASLIGNYNLVARIGGTFWVAFLTLIVTMPIVTTRVKKHR